MEKENKLVNVHFLYFDSEQKQANIFCNTLQNMKLKFSPEVDYAFTATCVSPMGNRYSSLLSEFSEWLDFINNDSISYKSRYDDGAGLEAALKRILEDVSGAVFDKNLFIVLGSRQKLDLKDKLIAQIGRKSGGFLFVQTKRSYDTPYQDFILQAKFILDKLSKEYTNSTADYIVDDKLVKLELFRNMETEDANVYLFDVPNNSLSFGGILFPKGRGELQNTTLELALDSINSHYRSIGINRNDFMALIQMRPDVPEDIRAVEWIAYASNAFNTMVPFYANVERTPAYLACTTGEVSTDSFYWVSRMIAAMADASYAKSLIHVERYEEGVLSASRALLNQYDKNIASAEESQRAALREEANTAIAAELKKRASDTLDKVLFELSSGMKNAYARSDA